jgi:hypothetical protein
VGFEPVSHYEVQVEHGWSVADLAGLVYSTSFLAAPLFGARTAEFEADLAYHLEPHLQSGGGVLVERVSYGYDLAQKPSN